ncbi:CHAT domain-containing protein [Kineococcus sp. SYSU DK005]|uniref:hypothetical protein n=1 Tax=Kineococcus sp. SYSU DK005 TaxID=3383126 RepID=UPI003D7CF76D
MKIWDEELYAAALKLSAARTEARRARIGATNPIDTLSLLLEALNSASKTYDAATSATDAAILDFAREHAKTCAQWLVVADGIDELIALDGVTPLNRQQSESVKWGVLTVLKNAVDVAQEQLNALKSRLPEQGMNIPEVAWCDIELRAILAQSMLIMRKVSPEILEGLGVSRYVEEFIAETTESRAFQLISDADKAWVWGLQFTLLTEDGKREEAKAALIQAEQLSTQDPEQRLAFLVNLLDQSSGVESWTDILTRLREHGNLTLGDEAPLSPARMSLVSRLASKHLSSALDLADSLDGSNAAGPLQAAVSLQQELLYGRIPKSPNGTLYHIVSAPGRQSTWLLKQSSDANVTSEAEKLSMDSRPLLKPFFKAQYGTSLGTHEIDQVRKLLADPAKILAESMGGCSGRRWLNAVGISGLLPFHAASVRDGVLANELDLSYLHPRLGDTSFECQPAPPTLLILDDYFGRDSARVERVLRNLWDSLSISGVVVKFNTSVEKGFDADVQEVLDLMANRSGWVYYGHGESQDHDARESSLILGPRATLKASVLAQSSLDKNYDAVIVACSGARPNPFVGAASMAHGAALAGASNVTSTMWPIQSNVGADYVEFYAKRVIEDVETASLNAWRGSLVRDRRRYSSFVTLTS